MTYEPLDLKTCKVCGTMKYKMDFPSGRSTCKLCYNEEIKKKQRKLGTNPKHKYNWNGR